MLDFGKWQNQVSKLHEQYEFGKPFPHIVLDDFFEPGFAGALCREFPQDIDSKGWIHWQHFNENKHGLNNPALLPGNISRAFDFMNGPEFIAFLEGLTGIPALIADSTLEGGGLHLSGRGGYLNIHTDFSAHPRVASLKRRLNVILYLNKGWLPEYKGDLEFWSEDMKTCEARIAPGFNRLVVFNTDDKSFHGFPEPILCGEGEARKSMALYYYTRTAGLPIASTTYRTRPGDGWRAVPNWIDNKLLFVYTFLKRKLKLKDDFASKILRSKQKK